MDAIKVTGLSKKYAGSDGHFAVDNISFRVEEGELFAFLGENGAGKSTTINMLSTILEKTGGSAEIFGHELGREDKEIRENIGIVFQNSVLDEHLTVKENLLTRGSYYGYSKKEIMGRLSKFMKSFELEEIWNRKYGTLSGGQRRRVDIVRALIHSPRLLFLDEPTTGLDPMSRKVVWDYINYLRREEKLTIFLTTHYMEETRDAGHVVIMDKGKIVVEGTPSELKSKYAKSRLVWYVPESEENAALLQGVQPGMQQETQQGFNVVYDADHYTAYFDPENMGKVTELLYEHRDRFTDYEIIKGSMDDVFLTVTGKKMGEDNE